MKIAGGADAGVVDLLNAERAGLPDDFGGEIDFVVRRANAGAELHDHVRGIGAETFNHLPDRVCDDAKLGAFASRMHQANRRRFWIQDVDCAAVGDVNAERDAALIGDNAIARGEFAAHRAAATAVDYCDVVTMDLFGGEQRPTPTSSRARDFIGVAKAGCVANFSMYDIEPLQHFGFIVGDVYPGNSLRENVTTDFDRA